MTEIAERLLSRTRLQPDAAERVAARLLQHPDLLAAVGRWLDGEELDRTLAVGGHTLGELVDRFDDTASGVVVLMDLREQPTETQAFLDQGWDRVVVGGGLQPIPDKDVAAFHRRLLEGTKPESHLPIVGSTVLNEMLGHIISGHTFDESPFADRGPAYREIWDQMERSVHDLWARGIEAVPANDPD